MLFDIIGTLASLLSTYYFIRLNYKAWPVGMIATLVNGWLYWYKGIYADMFLEVFYFLSMCYGWYLWQHKPTSVKKPSPLKKLTSLQWLFLSIVSGSTFACIHYGLKNFSTSNVAFMDAASTSLSLVAQWLMCHKIIVTWMIWFITDALYAFMYLSKNLPFHCGLMLAYTAMAITGFWAWKKKLNPHTP